MGRPANEGYSDEEIDSLGKEMMQWIKKVDKDNSVVHLSQFYCEIKDISYSQWKSLIQRKTFIPYYEKALLWMGRKIMMNKNLRESYGNRFLGIYFAEIREYERDKSREKIQDELELKKADAQQMASAIEVSLNGS